MSIRNVLPYVTLCPCADSEWEKLPHVILAHNKKYWNPTVFDCGVKLTMKHGLMRNHHSKMVLPIKLLMKQVITNSEVSKINFSFLTLKLSMIMMLITSCNLSLAVTTQQQNLMSHNMNCLKHCLTRHH